MCKKIVFIFLFILFIESINADERNMSYGDILLVDDYPFLLINVNYTITKKLNGEKSHGFSGEDGWIRYNTAISGKYILLLDFSSFEWDWAGDEDDRDDFIDFIEILKDKYEYEIIVVVQERYSRMAEVELEGGKKYIVVVELQRYGISE
ncbi:hypothetical protein FACS189476_02900 [Spirochaetia bacterium]|nr:hypothetical protein FACS189476_02900 [Spirochaetia bacterium]